MALPLRGRGLVVGLGANLWALGLVLPLAWCHGGAAWLIAPAAPALLALGVRFVDEQSRLRALAAPALLAGVPVASLAPLALPELEGARQSAFGFVALAASLAAFLWAALRALAGAAASPRSPITALPGEPAPAAWRRRMRIYRGFALLAAGLPALLVYAIDLHPSSVARFTAGYGAGAERAQSAATALAGLVCALVVAGWVMRPLGDHLERDFAVRVQIERARLVARRGRPRPLFYLAVGFALALMVAVLLLQGHA